MTIAHNASACCWPIRLKPQVDELLSSWMTRLARAYRQTPADFWRRVWPGPRISFRELDRRPPQGLLQLLSSKTGTPEAQIAATTLQIYEEYYLPGENVSGKTEQLSGGLYYRTWRGEAVRFCPKCLAGDAQPYFRRQWRLAFVTVCESHRVQLPGQCANCGAPVRYDQTAASTASLAACYRCGYDLRRMTAHETLPSESSSHLHGFQQRLLRIIEQPCQAGISRQGPSASEVVYRI